MNDVERWINLEGPEPPQISALLDPVREAAREAREARDFPPELAARLDRDLRIAVAARRRKWARERNLKIALGAGFAVACAAAVLVLVLRTGGSVDPSRVHEVAPNAIKLGPAASGAAGSTAPAASTDTGATRRAPKQSDAHPPSLR